MTLLLADTCVCRYPYVDGRVWNEDGRHDYKIASVVGRNRSEHVSAGKNSVVGDAGIVPGRGRICDTLFPTPDERSALFALPRSAPIAHRGRYGRLTGRAMAVFGKPTNATIGVTSMAGAVLPACGSARIHRRVGHGGGFRGGAADTPGLWDACSAVVFHGFQRVFADKTRKHRGTPAMDDPEFRVDIGSGHASQLHAVNAFRPALLVSAELHRGIVAVLGAESSPRGVHHPAAASTGTK